MRPVNYFLRRAFLPDRGVPSVKTGIQLHRSGDADNHSGDARDHNS
jgi:hypothetical protein